MSHNLNDSLYHGFWPTGANNLVLQKLERPSHLTPITNKGINAKEVCFIQPTIMLDI